MQCHDILIVIENAAVVPQRLAAAAALATRFGARLTGFFASGFPVTAAYGDVSGWEQLVDAYLEAQRREAAAAGAAFRQALTQYKLAGDWIFRESDETGSAIACGRPVLVVPYAGEFLDVGREILVAWNGSRESARALHDAMFLLPEAETVTIIEIDPPAPGAAAPAASAAQVAAALTRRGIAAKPETETAGDIGVSDLLLSRAADLDIDLLVMGAYGHSRMREFILGGVSRDIFRHMTVPVLMSH
jgi:nucleotide-binding universal stress UspA family protein